MCERSTLPVSVKTRVGIADDVEYDELLELFWPEARAAGSKA